MTKEELYEEANLEASIMPWDEETDTWEDIAERAYIKGAEPREKRIAELEKENAELRKNKEQLTKAKKILEKVITDFHNMDCVTVHIDKTIADAEQFLKDNTQEG